MLSTLPTWAIIKIRQQSNVIHCADTPDGQPVTIEQLDATFAARGFSREQRLIGHQQPRLQHIGYHFVVGVNGIVTSGLARRERGPAVVGQKGAALQVCLVGSKQFTLAQWTSLRDLVGSLRHECLGLNVIGHNTLNSKTNCPGFDVAQWLNNSCSPRQKNILEESNDAG
ncbi:MAG: hypothetical protein GXP10_07825 [Gammaproteobacteria bacterium]|nr:hypothetical protein [Gammaproteobacteria bacterium]